MENYAPVPPNSPPPFFQEDDAPIGSSLASPAHSYQQSQPRPRYHDTINQPPTSATISEGQVGSERNLSDFPSISQQAALTALQDHDNGTVLAWLTGFRSFRPGGQNWFQPNCLSPQQLGAVSALKECSDNHVSTWLEFVRRGGNFSTLHSYYDSSYLATERAAITSTRNTWQGSSDTSRTSSSSFGLPPSSYDGCASPSTQRSSWSRGTFFEPSGEPSIDETTAALPQAGAHTHWCFVCENPRVYITCDGWKRHMKEHETRYPCMPQGREVYTSQGPECVFCGDLNPDERHYNFHKVLPCSKKSLAARSYTRKTHLIHHLKTHGIPDGSALAEEWRDTLDKKFFSCGFCIACFQSHTDQLNHIDNAHYKKNQNISEWDSNTIILGLLHQPRVQESWRNILKAYPEFNDLGFRWSSAAVKKLQLRLEKSEETANNLALAAFNESTYDWTGNTQIKYMPAVGFTNQDTNAPSNLPIVWPQASPAQMPFTPSQSSIYDGTMMKSPVQTPFQAWRSIATSHISPVVPNANPTAYQNNSSQELMITNRPQKFY